MNPGETLALLRCVERGHVRLPTTTTELTLFTSELRLFFLFLFLIFSKFFVLY